MFQQPEDEKYKEDDIKNITERSGFPDCPAVKNLPAMLEQQEMWVQSLGWEDILEEGTATHSSILPGEFIQRVAKSWTRLRDFHKPLKKNKTREEWRNVYRGLKEKVKLFAQMNYHLSIWTK